jgi:hypothetical protein
MKKVTFLVVILVVVATLPSWAQFDKNTKKQKSVPEKSNDNMGTSATSNNTEESNQDPEEKKGFDPKKLVFSPIIGLSFNPLVIQTSPKVGYRFTKRVIAGVSINYVYYKQNGIDPNTNLQYTATSRILGGGLFGSFKVTEFLFGAADLELNTYKSTISELNQHIQNPLAIYPSLLLGAGVNLNGFYIKAQYDVLNQNPFYQNRVVTSFGYFF